MTVHRKKHLTNNADTTLRETVSTKKTILDNLGNKFQTGATIRAELQTCHLPSGDYIGDTQEVQRAGDEL